MSITVHETMNLLVVYAPVGMDMELFPGGDRSLTDELFILTQPAAHFAKTAFGKTFGGGTGFA